MFRQTTVTSFLLFAALVVQAQFHGGFKTGLNFANINGPSETDLAGKGLETWKNATGFHIGAALSYELTDNFGIAADVLYSKKGTRYSFEGQSYRYINYDGGSTYTEGTSKYLLNVSNTYFDIPLMAYARLRDFEFSAGVYASLLIQSSGEGSLVYQGISADQHMLSTDELKFILDYNYIKDDPGVGDSKETVVANTPDGKKALPRFLGAYYDLPEDKGHLYNTLDYGLVGGVAYNLSRSLFFGVRLQYGLSDLTNNDADLAKAATNNGTLLYRDDADRNFTIQASVGFRF